MNVAPNDGAVFLTVIEPTSLKLVGLSVITRGGASEGPVFGQIQALWAQLRARLNEISGRVGADRYALITGDLTEQLPVSRYYALVAVDSFEGVPASFEKIDLSGRRMAKFTHKGTPFTVGQTALKVINSWIPSSGESIQHNEELCIISPEYDPANADSEFEYGVFI
ncbi:MAG: GyrI-like domain-containing protein [Bacteroidetes bacterium]|nr:GyrI-like domain-containing protein [Bacteroidota bacterium]